MPLRLPPWAASLRSRLPASFSGARVLAARRGLWLNTGLGVVALVGALYAYHLVTATAETTSTTPTGASRTVPVTQGEVSATVSATGSVQSAHTATADFVTGGTVASIAVHVGDTVTQGQELARVDPAAAQASVDTARANLTAARASLTRAQNGGDDATIAAAQAQVTSASAAVDAAVRALDGTVLTAPIAGTITAVNGSVGSTTGSSGSSGSSGGGGGGAGGSGGSGSSSSSSGFVQLADLSSMQASVSFAEADATRLKEGQAATITWSALAGASATGSVTTIAPTATTSNNVNSYAVVVSLTKLPAGVRIGQTVTVNVVVGDVADALRVPTAAVRTVNNRHVVTVVGANGATELREVAIGVEGNTFIEIKSGLRAGEQVAIVTSTTTTTNGTNGFPGGGLGGGGLGGGGLGGGFTGGGAGGGGAGRAGQGSTR
jgi:multidrug efflux pump subunit AcrA (membrane-fusion protein)